MWRSWGLSPSRLGYARVAGRRPDRTHQGARLRASAVGRGRPTRSGALFPENGRDGVPGRPRSGTEERKRAPWCVRWGGCRRRARNEAEGGKSPGHARSGAVQPSHKVRLGSADACVRRDETGRDERDETTRDEARREERAEPSRASRAETTREETAMTRIVRGAAMTRIVRGAVTLAMLAAACGSSGGTLGTGGSGGSGGRRRRQRRGRTARRQSLQGDRSLRTPRRS